MKLYKVYVLDGKQARWVGSLADAATTRKEFNTRQHIPRDRILTMEVDVPQSKKGLLEFLNHEIE